MLFDERDEQLARNLAAPEQGGSGFFEGLSAVLLYEATGLLSMQTNYVAKNHPEERRHFEQLGPGASRAYRSRTPFLAAASPMNSRLQNKQNAHQYAPVVQRLTAGMRLAASPDWKQWLDYFPQFIINQFACPIALPR